MTNARRCTRYAYTPQITVPTDDWGPLTQARQRQILSAFPNPRGRSMKWLKTGVYSLALSLGPLACLVPKGQLVKQQEETATCYDTLRAENAQRKELSAALNTLQQSFADLAAERKSLAAEKGTLQSNLAARESDIRRQMGEISVLARRNTRLETDRQTLQQKTATYDALVSSLQSEMQEKLIEVKRQGERITVNVSDRVLFLSGSAEVLTSGQAALTKIANVLAEVNDRRIDIEGHTDSLPMTGKLAELYPTNWELSAARATNVVKYLEGQGVNPKRMAVVGKSSFRPVASNGSAAGRKRNRRIEIVLTPWDRR